MPTESRFSQAEVRPALARRRMRKQARFGSTTTVSPMRSCGTRSPTATTVPNASWPMIHGVDGVGHLPLKTLASDPHRPTPPTQDLNVVRADLFVGNLVDDHSAGRDEQRGPHWDAARCKEPPRVGHHHLVDLLLSNAGRPKPRQHVGDDVVHAPPRSGSRPPRRWRHVTVEGRVVRDHDSVGIAELDQRQQRVDAPLVVEHVLHAEPVQTDRRSRVHQLAQVVDVVGVTRVADHQPIEWHAVCAKELLLLESVARRGIASGS